MFAVAMQLDKSVVVVSGLPALAHTFALLAHALLTKSATQSVLYPFNGGQWHHRFQRISALASSTYWLLYIYETYMPNPNPDDVVSVHTGAVDCVSALWISDARAHCVGADTGRRSLPD